MLLEASKQNKTKRHLPSVTQEARPDEYTPTFCSDLGEKFRDSSLTFQIKKGIYPFCHLSTWLQQRPAEPVDWSRRANTFYFIKSLNRGERKRREWTGASESWLEFKHTNVSLRLMYSKIIGRIKTDAPAVTLAGGEQTIKQPPPLMKIHLMRLKHKCSQMR